MKTVSTEEYKKFSSQNILKEVLKDEDGEYGGLMQRVFNGQLGVIVNINLENDVISVYYPNENYIALYTAKAFAERTIDLGYAITIHKSQGMEYNHIVIPMSSSHYVMLNNNLLYTAVTRAKDNLHLVGETFAFERACKNKEEIKRNSILQHLKGVA
jgi:exodeoxyribonuclease V alpha subunit